MTDLYVGVYVYVAGSQKTGVMVTWPVVPVSPPMTGDPGPKSSGGLQVGQFGFVLAARGGGALFPLGTLGTNPRGWLSLSGRMLASCARTAERSDTLARTGCEAPANSDPEIMTIETTTPAPRRRAIELASRTFPTPRLMLSELTAHLASS